MRTSGSGSNLGRRRRRPNVLFMNFIPVLKSRTG